MVVASRGDEYRRRAQECLAIAPTFRNDQSRNVLLQMAQVWLRLADNYEADSYEADSYEAANKMVGRPEAAEEIRPTVQQQQQIQPK